MRIAVLSALSAACLILCIWALLLLRRARRENARLRQTVQSCQLQAQELERQTEALRELRHDLRHYIQVSGQGDASIPPELETLLRTPVGGTGPVAALAAFYRRQAESLGAQADLRLELEPVDSRMLPDLCLLLSNLLENAVECLAREGGGWLRARTIRAPGYVTVVVGNSCRSAPKGAHCLPHRAAVRRRRRRYCRRAGVPRVRLSPYAALRRERLPRCAGCAAGDRRRLIPVSFPAAAPRRASAGRCGVFIRKQDARERGDAGLSGAPRGTPVGDRTGCRAEIVLGGGTGGAERYRSGMARQKSRRKGPSVPPSCAVSVFPVSRRAGPPAGGAAGWRCRCFRC